MKLKLPYSSRGLAKHTLKYRQTSLAHRYLVRIVDLHFQSDLELR